MHKGQISSLDMVVAATVFMLIFLSVMWAWNDSRLRIDRFEDRRAINEKALQVTELLVIDSGNPENWHSLDTVNSSTVNSMGLAKEGNVLDSDKLDRFSDIDYGEQKRLLGLSKEDFNLTVYNISDGGRASMYSYGRVAGNLTRVGISRFASLGDDLAELRLILFYNQSTYLTT